MIGLKRQEEILVLRGKLLCEGDFQSAEGISPASARRQPTEIAPSFRSGFAGGAGTESHGPMDHPNKALAC